ncbi:MAG TPA: cytochrome b N-terminal domain-containing protein [Terrimicrobiaceae bacterium]|nr:cytochrome b N-terminal domain-containing protein [Terrimicrobiaceae bacterium]
MGNPKKPVQQIAFEAAQSVFVWLDSRLHLTNLWEHTAGHHIPKSSASWFYVFGSATLLCLMIQIVTGSLLAFAYVPSGAEAYTTLEYLTYEQPLGWYLRGLHYWGSNFMVTIMFLHMTQVFLFGAYKYPREITWISGCILMLCTLGMAFTGQVLRFDEDAYWGLGIGAAIVGRVPIIGEQLVHLMLGGPIIASETLSRFFSLHVFIIPGTILALVALHLRMVLTKGINEYPKPGHLVRRETYDKEYEQIIKKEGIPFAPYGIWKDLVTAAVVIGGIMLCAAVFGPKGPTGPPFPVEIDSVPRPDFFFMWIFAVAALMPDYMETFMLLVAPPVIILILFALPFFNGTGEKSWRRRPIAVLTVIFIYIVMGMLTYLGITSPWSPDMHAWTADGTEASRVVGRSPLELQGLVVLQNKQCRNCHAIDGVGGHRGPDLANVGTRLTASQLARQVIQGGGNMPAYGKNLSPYEVDALVAYMVSLRPEGEAPARDSSIPAVPPKEQSGAAAKKPSHGGS